MTFTVDYAADAPTGPLDHDIVITWFSPSGGFAAQMAGFGLRDHCLIHTPADPAFLAGLTWDDA